MAILKEYIEVFDEMTDKTVSIYLPNVADIFGTDTPSLTALMRLLKNTAK